MIKNIEIRQLFGTYNYAIDLINDEHVCVMFGPNGYGKTTILNIIYNIVSRNFWYFYFLKFMSIVIMFTDRKKISIEKKKEDKHFYKGREDEVTNEFAPQVEFKFFDGNGKEKETFSLNDKLLESYKSRYELRTRLRRVDYEFKDFVQNELKCEDLPLISKKCMSTCMYLRLCDCTIIRDQRIIHDSYEKRVEPLRIKERRKFEIEYISSGLKDKFRKEQSDFAKWSQEIDGDFINRLMKEHSRAYDKDLLKNKLGVIKQKIENFRRYDLLPEISIPDEYTQDANLQQSLSLYVEDMDKKLGKLDEFYSKLYLMDQLINGKCLSNKSIMLNGERGLYAIDDKGNEISLNKLSSGEQNLIILYYNLVFNTKEGSVVLVDEPENSLHVSWISDMLKDYIAIAKKMNCQVIFSTHSPVFIDEYWDLTVNLFENSKQNA